MQNAIDNNEPSWTIKRLRAALVELTAWDEEKVLLHKQLDDEIADLEMVLAGLYKAAERHSHQDGTLYTDDEMYEANAELEFLTMATKEIQADMLAHGRPSQPHIRWLMRTPKGIELLKQIPTLNAEGMSFLPLVTNESQLLQIGTKNEAN